jgi:formylglycine-generating enzyme required for sulfatase activity
MTDYWNPNLQIWKFKKRKMYTRTELLRKAIACYEQAGQIEDMCRCLRALGEYVEAAELYAANNEPWLSAWMYAEGAHLFHQARYLVQDLPVNDLADELSRDLILARCDAERLESQAGLVVSKVIKNFPNLPLIHRQRIEEWAVAVAQRLGRFDLVATTYAIAYTTGTPESEVRWEAWALSTLGDATGVPTTPSIDTGTPFEFETVTVNKRGEIINRRRLQATQIIEQVNGVEIAMVSIVGGTFLMGSPEDEAERISWEGPQHQVTIEPFYMGKYPVTQAQWLAVMGSNPSRFKDGNWENRPVEKVSWNDAIAFCDKLSKLTGQEYRLPSEAEWEYACRAGTTTPFYFGETITSDLANYNSNYTYASEPEGVYRQETTEIGKFPPNGFGLSDMHGNVEEWCGDNWHENYEGAPIDGSVWKGGDESSRVLRGGSWFFYPIIARAASRSWYDRIVRNGIVGFRVAARI